MINLFTFLMHHGNAPATPHAAVTRLCPTKSLGTRLPTYMYNRPKVKLSNATAGEDSPKAKGEQQIPPRKQPSF